MVTASTRLTPMAAMVLALLAEGDMHPYEMSRLLRIRRDDRIVKVTNGTLYHSVGRLLEMGLIAEVGTERDGNRPERTTYSLTAAGADVISEWVRAALSHTEHPVAFRVALAEAHDLERAEVTAALSMRSAALAEEIQSYIDGLTAAREQAVPEQFLIEVDRQRALLEADLAWQRGFLDRLDAGKILWGPAGRTSSDRYRAQRKAAQL